MRSVVIGAARRGMMALVLAAGFMATFASATDSAGNVFCNGVRLQDEIVVVNTRMLCGSCDPESLRTGLRFETYSICNDAGARRWQASDLESFLAFDSSVRTIIFVHGNRITPGDAKHEGLSVYRKLANYAGDGERIRFVIWSWPSGQTSGPLRDVREKAARTGPAGCQLAWFLDQMPTETPVSLVGFSFGARIITGGLHILAGGSLGGCTLAEHVHPNRPPMNVVLMAAALHANWLGDGQYHGLAMTQVDRMFLVNSCQDMAMRYYRFVQQRGNPQALGLCGPTRISGENAAKIQMRDVGRCTGSTHNLFLYLCAPGVVGQISETTTATTDQGVAMVN
ncbi:MAG: hypothetical protein WD468_12110 [Pirellulales bacterium]